MVLGGTASLFHPVNRAYGSTEIGGGKINGRNRWAWRLRVICRRRAIDKLAQPGNGGISAMRCDEPAAIEQNELPVKGCEPIGLAPLVLMCIVQVGDQQADGMLIVMNGELGSIFVLRER